MQFLKKLLLDSEFWLSVFVISYAVIDQNPMFLWSLLIIWIVNNTVPLIVHEGWAHKYLLPKNKLIGYLLDLYAYAITQSGNHHYSNRAHWAKYHIEHHKQWKNKYDHIEYAIRNNNHLLWLFCGSTNKTMPNVHSPEVITLFRKQTHKELDNIEQWIDNHNFYVKFGIHLLFLLVFGWEPYFYLLLIPSYSFTLWMKFFTETIAHWKRETQEDEKDYWWLFPIAGCNAFHYSHHKNQNEMQLGNGFWKYLHINYWFMKIFYKQQVPLA